MPPMFHLPPGPPPPVCNELLDSIWNHATMDDYYGELLVSLYYSHERFYQQYHREGPVFWLPNARQFMSSRRPARYQWEKPLALIVMIVSKAALVESLTRDLIRDELWELRYKYGRHTDRRRRRAAH